jgi:hypothetical protein
MGWRRFYIIPIVQPCGTRCSTLPRHRILKKKVAPMKNASACYLLLTPSHDESRHGVILGDPADRARQIETM